MTTTGGRTVKVPNVTVDFIPYGKPRKRDVEGVVLHAMGEHIITNVGTLSAFDFLMRSPEIAGFSYSAHCLAHPNGHLTQCVPDERRAWHAGESRLGDLVGLNHTFLGIEFLLAGSWSYAPDFIDEMHRGTVGYTDEQYLSGAWWTATKMHQYGFNRSRVVTHAQVAGDDVRGPGNGKLDPGVGFNHGRFSNEIFRWLEHLEAPAAG